MKKLEKHAATVELSFQMFSALRLTLPKGGRSYEAIEDLLHRIGIEAIENYEQKAPYPIRNVDEHAKSRIDISYDAQADVQTNQKNLPNEGRASYPLRTDEN